MNNGFAVKGALWSAIAPRGARVLAIAGGGGKTSLMYSMAAEAALSGVSAAIFTTTRIMPPNERQCLACVIDGDLSAAASALETQLMVCCGSPAENGKLAAPSADTIEFLLERAGVALIEADGSRHLPLKLCAAHEPAIPPYADAVIAVAGLDALGKPLSAVCHRHELASDYGIDEKAIVTRQLMAELLIANYGRFDPICAVFNKADTRALAQIGTELAQAMNSNGFARSAVTRLSPCAEVLYAI